MQNTNYYTLECFAPDDWDDLALVEGIAPPVGEISWRSGIRFVNPPDEPVAVSLHPDYGVQIKELRTVDALLMTHRLYEAFVAAGVLNLDAYSAVIRHPGRNFETHDYVACNLVGVVAAVDFEKSVLNGFGARGLVDADFNSVVLDENCAGELLMFRLAENSSAVVVHQSVKEYLLANGFTMLSFISPEEWMG